MLEAFELCAHHPQAPGQVFIFGDNAAVTVRELIYEMAAVAGVAPPKLSLPRWMLPPLCRLVERSFTRLGKEPPLSERSLKFFTNNTSFNIERARQELGFTPKVSLHEGLRLTYAALHN